MITCFNDLFLKGTFSKFENALAFLNSKTDGGLFKPLITDRDLLKEAGVLKKNAQGQFVPSGWQAQAIGINASNPRNIRGDRVDMLIYDECFGKDTPVLMSDYSVKYIQDIKIGDFVLGIDGTPQEVMHVTSGIDTMYKIQLKRGITYTVNSKHKLYTEFRPRIGNIPDLIKLQTAEEVLKLSKYYQKTTYGKFASAIDNNFDYCELNPYYFGLWIGDGRAGKPNNIIVNVEDDIEISNWLKNYLSTLSGEITISKNTICNKCIYYTLSTKHRHNELINSFKKYNLINNKHIPIEILKSSLNYKLKVLAGIIDTDGSKTKRGFEINMSNKILILQIKKLAQSCGFTVKYSERKSNGFAKNRTMSYRIFITGNVNIIPTLISRKQFNINLTNTFNSTAITITKLNKSEYYGITLKSYGKNTDNLFLLEDFTIVHNCGSWPNLQTAVVQGQELCEVLGVPRGFMLFGGTGGDSGPNLEGLKQIYYHPRTYKVLPFRHNCTQDGSYIESGFFLPYFAQSLNKKYMDSRGVCDVERYKEEVLIPERNLYLEVPEDYLKKCAERCWTAEEAFNLEGVNKFNKMIIANQLAEIRLHKRCPKIHTGLIDYTYKNSRHVEENINGFRWIPMQNGKVKILEHPVWSDLYKEDLKEKKKKAEENGEEFVIPEYNEMENLYVAGIDGIDIGQNQTSSETRDPSDFCIVIKKRAFGLNDPQYVCMYKDRPADVREAYKIAMCLCRYYNAKINIEATRMAMVNWARDRKGYLKYFMKRPRATLTDVKYGTTKQIGTPATKVIIEQQTDLIADFVEDYGHTIWFEEMLDELNSYNDENKTKFDIVASLGMLELADLELSGRQPKTVEKEETTFEDFGYYIDERGYKRFGVIPKPPQINIDINFNLKYDDPYRIETSDPRLYLGAI